MARSPFQKIDDAERRTIAWRLWVNETEAAAIEHAAAIRKLDRSDFVRRAALGRRADVRYEMEIVLTLSTLVQEIRELHEALTANGAAPSAELSEGLREIVTEARDAILRIQP